MVYLEFSEFWKEILAIIFVCSRARHYDEAPMVTNIGFVLFYFESGNCFGLKQSRLLLVGLMGTGTHFDLREMNR